jgi:GTPase involved in cell partitioning and DNA repair
MCHQAIDPVEAFDGHARAGSARPRGGGKPKLVVASKIDALDDPDRLKALQDFCEQEGLEVHSISAATGAGIAPLLGSVLQHLERLHASLRSEEDFSSDVEIVSAFRDSDDASLRSR